MEGTGQDWCIMLKGHLLFLLLFVAHRLLFTAQAFVARDPRFDDLSGEFNESYFKQSYGFLSDVKLRDKQVFVLQPVTFGFALLEV